LREGRERVQVKKSAYTGRIATVSAVHLGLLTASCGDPLRSTSDPPSEEVGARLPRDASTREPEVGPQDASVAQPDAGAPSREALRVLVERHSVVLYRFTTDDLGGPSGPARTVVPDLPFDVAAGFPDVGLEGKRWLGGVRRLADEKLVLTVNGDCMPTRWSADLKTSRARFLGRALTGTCVPVESSMGWLSPDGRWFRDGVDEGVGSFHDDSDNLTPLDAPNVPVAEPTCPGRDGRNDATAFFFGWDGDEGALSATYDRCLMRTDLVTGVAREVVLPADDCRVVLDAADVLLKTKGRWLLDCDSGIQAFTPGGDAEPIASGWRLVYRAEPVVTEAGTALRVERERGNAVLWIPSRGRPRIDASPRPNTSLSLVADSRTGQPAAVEFERAPGEAGQQRVRLYSVGSEGLKEELSALLPAGVPTTVVVGDVRAGPLFVAWAQTAGAPPEAVYAVRAQAGGVERLAGVGEECVVLPWQGESKLAFLRCDETTVLDLREPQIRTWPLGRVLSVLTAPGSVEVLGTEAVTEVAMVDDTGRLRSSGVDAGVPRHLGTSGGATAILRAPRRVAPSAPPQVDIFVAGRVEPAATLPVVGEVLGFRGGRILTLHDGVLTAQPWDGAPASAFQVPGVAADSVLTSDESESLAFVLDAAGTLNRLELATGEVRRIAHGLPPGPVTRFFHDAASTSVVFALGGSPTRVFALPADPNTPAEAPRPAVMGVQADFAPGRPGDGPVAWDDDGVYRLCPGGACVPRWLSGHFGIDAPGRGAGAYHLTPSGTHLVNSCGTSIALAEPEVLIPATCHSDRPCGVCRGEDAFDVSFSDDGERAMIASELVVRPRDGRAVSLPGLGPDRPGWSSFEGARLRGDGVVSAHMMHPDDNSPDPRSALKLRWHDRDLRLVGDVDLQLGVGSGRYWDSQGVPLDARGEFGLLIPEDPEALTTTRLVTFDTRRGGAVTRNHSFMGRVLHIW
jgi:hypothetical protein